MWTLYEYPIDKHSGGFGCEAHHCVFNYTPAQRDWELRHEILDQFLAIPGG